MLKQRQIFRHLGSKRFSVQMSVRHIAGIYLKNWGDLSLRLFLMRICFLQQMPSNTDNGVAYAAEAKVVTFTQLYDEAAVSQEF